MALHRHELLHPDPAQDLDPGDFAEPGQARGGVHRLQQTESIHTNLYRILTLAAYVGEDVIIRYDPRDLAEVRVYYRETFLCRAICPELAGETIALKDIIRARNAHRRELRATLAEREATVQALLGLRRGSDTQPPLPQAELASPPTPSRPRLKRYFNDE